MHVYNWLLRASKVHPMQVGRLAGCCGGLRCHDLLQTIMDVGCDALHEGGRKALHGPHLVHAGHLAVGAALAVEDDVPAVCQVFQGGWHGADAVHECQCLSTEAAMVLYGERHKGHGMPLCRLLIYGAAQPHRWER